MSYWWRYKQIWQNELTEFPGAKSDTATSNDFTIVSPPTVYYEVSDQRSWSLGPSLGGSPIQASGNYTVTSGTTGGASHTINPDSVDQLDLDQFYLLRQMKENVYCLEERINSAPAPAQGETRPWNLPANEIDGAAGDSYVQMSKVSTDSWGKERIVATAVLPYILKWIPNPPNP